MCMDARSKGLRELAHEIIDLVEERIRKEHPVVDKYAEQWFDEENEEFPNTLLYGEAYYDVEDVIITWIEDLLEEQLEDIIKDVTIVHCPLYWCKNNRDGECSLNAVEFVENDEPHSRGLACVCYCKR